MNKLMQELQRLYFLQELPPLGQFEQAVAQCRAGESRVALDLVSPDGMVRAMVIGFERAADWEQVAELYQGLQDDLELPLPAVAVSGQAGYQLWLSLAEYLPVAEARLFLEALRRQYLADIPLASLRFSPDTEPAQVTLVPALHEASGKWSAFIDPSMGAMFVDESGLDMAPNMDRQADMLAGLERIKATDFQRALAILQAMAEAKASRPERSAPPSAHELGRTRSPLTVGNNFTDPKAFLLAVMNDPSATAGQRIKAAQALLPYCKPSGSE